MSDTPKPTRVTLVSSGESFDPEKALLVAVGGFIALLLLTFLLCVAGRGREVLQQFLWG